MPHPRFSWIPSGTVTILYWGSLFQYLTTFSGNIQVFFWCEELHTSTIRCECSWILSFLKISDYVLPLILVMWQYAFGVESLNIIARRTVLMYLWPSGNFTSFMTLFLICILAFRIQVVRHLPPYTELLLSYYNIIS